MPVFSILSKEKIIDKKIQKVEKVAERAEASEEKVRIIEKAVKEVGTAVGITKESRHFNYTAIGHSIRD